MNSASAVICWKDKILLFHRDLKPKIFPDHWQLPGGGIEKGETPLQGLKRELTEEVSYVPKKIELLGNIQRENGTTYVYTSFVDDEEARLFKIGEIEGKEIGFFTIDEALKLKLTPELRNYTIKFKDEIKKGMREKSFPKITL